MRPAEELKRIFQEGWNIPARVDNYVHNVAETEFTEGERYEAWRTALDAAVQVPNGLQVLDVGTGPGVFACLYARMGHRCVGLDFSNRMLAEATKRAEQLKVTCDEWHLNFCKLLYGKVIWTKKASLVTRGCCNQFPNGKEAKDGSFVSRHGGGGSSARRLVLRRVASPRSYPQSVRSRKSSLARLGVHARDNRMGLSLAMSQPGPFLPRCRGPAHCLAFGTGSLAVLGRHRGLLHGARRSAGRSPSCVGARHRQAGRGRIAGDLALAWAKGPRGGRVHHHHARHARRIRRPIRSRKRRSPAAAFPSPESW